MSKLINGSVLNSRFNSGLPNIFKDTLMYARYATGGEVNPIGERQSNYKLQEYTKEYSSKEEEENKDESVLNHKKKKFNIEKMDFSNYYKK